METEPEYLSTIFPLDCLEPWLTDLYFNDLPVSAFSVSHVVLAADKAENLQSEWQREKSRVSAETQCELNNEFKVSCSIRHVTAHTQAIRADRSQHNKGQHNKSSDVACGGRMPYFSSTGHLINMIYRSIKLG